ncbi:hypothetical protein C0Z11_05275 [Acidipropionibacterium jensenii]|uniref:sensor histidine kinase n=1 Tax=Acidipropionibacterium jensenii TaxID=1749 RepID=UPI000BC32C13|nr:ATP-binding protein [Acidipropionibacterium jensenii]AZZ41788.1 hypothetical protein C0Z11_05275 [Acidipropionibacterium jensenii]
MSTDAADRQTRRLRASRRRDDPAGRLQRAVTVLRWVLLGHAILMGVLRWQHSSRPWALAAVLTAMLIWTAVMTAWVRRDSVPPLALTGVDVLIAVSVTAISQIILGPSVRTASFEGIGSYWVICAALSAALIRGPLLGLLAALLVIAPGLAGVGHGDLWAWSADLLLVVACVVLGRLIDQIRRMMADRERDQAVAARLAERERLGRIVHDGALQVLSMVEREGPDLGPRGQALARLAHEQGGQLRRMLQMSAGEGARAEGPPNLKDLVAAVESHEGESVTVSAMAGELLLPAHLVDELDKAVVEIISNVAHHAGAAAHCWILIEEEAGTIVISERDNGSGMSPGQAEQAAAEGRMGITHSIAGRIHALGGTTTMRTSEGHGVEWEIRVPTGRQAVRPVPRSQ